MDHDYKYFSCAQCGYTFKAPVYCGNRFCQVCTAPRRRRVRKRLENICKHIKEEKGYGVKLLTLTLPNSSSLREGVDLLIASFRRLRQRHWWYNRVRGGAWVVEVTGRPNDWHIHLHALLESRYLPHKKLSKEWQCVSPGKIVHITAVPSRSIISYVTKYCSKTEVAEDHRIEVSRKLTGVRLFQPFGLWHGWDRELPKVKYECPSCGYTGFYWNPEGESFILNLSDQPVDKIGKRTRQAAISKHGDLWLAGTEAQKEIDEHLSWVDETARQVVLEKQSALTLM